MEDDEPELWVLEPDDEDDEDDGPAAAPAPTDAPTELTSTLTSDDVAGDDWADTSWLDELAPQPRGADAPGTSPTAPPNQPPTAPPAAPGQGDDRPAAPAGDGRTSTSADEFAGLRDAPSPGRGRVPPQPPDRAAPPDKAASTEQAARSGEPGGPGEAGPDGTAGDPPSVPRTRRSRPTARGDEVSEFLRELSRLALDDD